jgi:hypothetical protein
MHQFRIKKQATTRDRHTARATQRLAVLSDDAQGADRYLELKKQGYVFERLSTSEEEGR